MASKKLTQADIAAALGVSAGMVSRYRSQGMPVHDLQEAIAWKKANIRPRVKPRRNLEQAGLYDYEEARARREHFAAEREQRKALAEAGELYQKSEVLAIAASAATTLRLALEQFGARLAPELVGQSEATIKAALDDAVREALQDASATFAELAKLGPKDE